MNNTKSDSSSEPYQKLTRHTKKHGLKPLNIWLRTCMYRVYAIDMVGRCTVSTAIMPPLHRQVQQSAYCLFACSVQAHDGCGCHPCAAAAAAAALKTIDIAWWVLADVRRQMTGVLVPPVAALTATAALTAPALVTAWNANTYRLTTRLSQMYTYTISVCAHSVK